MTKNTIGTAPRARDVDELIARYAPIGMHLERKRRVRLALTATGCAFVAGAGALASILDMSLLERASGLLQPFTAQGPGDAGRVAANQGEFVARLTELEGQIAAVRMQKHELEEQRADFDERSRQLALLLEQTGAEQTELERQQQQGSQLDQEIAALAAQRKALETRWAQFEAQGELLALEIVAVNAQRKELESQRQQIDRQRRELAELLERADAMLRRSERAAGVGPVQEASTVAADYEPTAYTNNSLLVDNGELDEMRGGFTIGQGLDFSIGFAHTGSLNGEEQFSNSFMIDSLASGLNDIDMSNMSSIVLQNGPGNFVLDGVLDSFSNSFGNIIQNSLDNQVISTTTTYDIALHNVSGAMQGLAGQQALMDSLESF